MADAIGNQSFVIWILLSSRGLAPGKRRTLPAGSRAKQDGYLMVSNGLSNASLVTWAAPLPLT
jgi:hypothetical protein